MKVETVRNHWWTPGGGGLPKRYRKIHIATVEDLAEAADLMDDTQPTVLTIDSRAIAGLASLARRVVALEKETQ